MMMTANLSRAFVRPLIGDSLSSPRHIVLFFPDKKLQGSKFANETIIHIPRFFNSIT